MRASLSVHRPLRSANSQSPSHTYRLSWAHSMISASGLSPPEQTLVNLCETDLTGTAFRIVQRSGGALPPRGPL